MNMNYEDLILQRDAKGSMDGGKQQQTDSDKWEMDAETTLDRLYHGWLGEKLKEGVWVRDVKLKKMMNEECASYLIQILHSHFNVNMQFSVIDQNELIDILTSVWEVVNDVLTANYHKFNVDVNMITTINTTIRNALWIWLKIPFMGGMRLYKGDKTKMVINKQEVSSNGAF